MDETGKPIAIVGCWFDISKRKSFEESMRQLTSIIDSSDDPIVSLTLQGTVVSWNPSAAKTYGYSRDEMIGQPIFKLLAPKRRDEFKALIDRASTGTRLGHLESIHLTKSKNCIDVALTISPVRDVTGTITGISFISRDISEQKRLEQELGQITQKHNEDLRLLTHALQQAQEEERRRVSRELHDDLNQRLSNLKLSMEMMIRSRPRTHGKITEDLQGFAQQLDTLIRDVRKIAANLRPTILDDFGLAVGIELLCNDFEKLHHRTVLLSKRGCIDNRFNSQVEIALYRVAQESFVNIAKHSTATTIEVTLLCDASSLTMIIQDNGSGFDLNEVRSRKGPARGLGFTGMRERIEMVGGRFHIHSSPKTGAVIEAVIPRDRCTRQP
jgi:PAS domain S-box-containing protein